MWFDPSTLPLTGAQRMVPVGPLLELVTKLRTLGEDASFYREMSTAYAVSAAQLDTLLASLLGESPEGGEVRDA
jgi:hypothetical protein